MMREQVVLSWSGGKDSSLALAALQADSRYQVVGLITTVTREYERVSIHGVRRTLLESQAAALGLPLFEVELDPRSSNESYERAFLLGLHDVREVIPEARHIAFGDLYLADVREYRERLLGSTDFAPLFPLWGRDTKMLAEEFIAAGFHATLVCVDTEQISGEFAGMAFDRNLLNTLPATVDPCGEGGEFHTFVSAGPVFSRAIGFEIGEKVLRDNRFAYCDLIPASENGEKNDSQTEIR